MKRRKKKVTVKQLRKQLSALAAAIIVLFVGFITLNEQFHLFDLPTWDELYVLSGLREDVSLPGTQLRVTVRNAGNADCILLQNGTHFALIDAGENDDGEDLVEFFNRTKISRLEYVIATHPDGDHIGGMDDVVDHMEIGTFLMRYMPDGYAPTTKTYENLLTALVENEVVPLVPQYGDTFSFGDAEIQILSGLSEQKETNEQSIVCKIVFGNTSFLMMGDAGEMVEKELLTARADLRADVLKVGHHGSRNSSSEDFIRQVSPQYALITCGLGNNYGHPHRETLNTLITVDATVYRSDLHGNITLISDGQSVTVETEK